MKGHLGALGLIILAAPAAAAGTIPIAGAFGNAPGCVFFATGRASERMQLLTPDTFASSSFGCDFDSAVEADGVFAISGVCSTPGMPPRSGEVLRVKASPPGYIVIDGANSIGPLLPCVSILEQGVGV